MKTKSTTALIATALGLIFAIPAQAQADEYINIVYNSRIAPTLSAQGFRILDTTMTPLIPQGGSHTFTITPRYGARVKLVAVGDWDSNDVDMYVRGGETRRLIDSDTLDDDTPITEFTSRGGSYQVIITVPDTDRPAYVKLVYSAK